MLMYLSSMNKNLSSWLVTWAAKQRGTEAADDCIQCDKWITSCVNLLDFYVDFWTAVIYYHGLSYSFSLKEGSEGHGLPLNSIMNLNLYLW